MSIKKLAGQTLWYGVPTIVGKFLSYFLNLLLIWIYEPVNISSITQLYVLVPFLNIIFTYGLETSFFRFIREGSFKRVYGTMLTSITVSTLVLSLLMLPVIPYLTHRFKADDHPGFFYWMLTILVFDTLSALPFARLRYEERPRKFALIKMLNVSIHLGLFVFFIALCPKLYTLYPNSPFLFFYNPSYNISYYVIANILASLVTLILLGNELFSSEYVFDGALLRRILRYSFPLLIVGFGGMIGELFSRLTYTLVATGTDEQVRHELGVFSGVYRIVVMVNMFIFAYRMAAEPFFFRQAQSDNARETYARLMNVFVMVCCTIFLIIVLYLDAWEYIITLKSKSYAEAISIIPILSVGAIFLGIYYNQSVWYKLSDRNKQGAYITVAGAAITIAMNLLLIPVFKYNGAAWATLTSYLFMMVTSYIMGQKYYPIPYDLKKVFRMISVALLLYGVQYLLSILFSSRIVHLFTATILLFTFIGWIIRSEKALFSRFPLLSKFTRE